MVKYELTSQITSLPDRESVVCEIYAGSEQVAEISNESGEGLRIEIFNSPDGAWSFDLDTFSSLVEQGKKSII
ncbi:hypothetical protein ABDM77_16830 [Mangrovibacter phragmitis]